MQGGKVMSAGGRALLLISIAVAGFAQAQPLLSQSQPAAERQQQLLHLLRNDCGACHGMTRKGGLGLPLTAAALREKPDELLVATILDGRAGTAMPPWRRFLTEAEAQWLVTLLKQDTP